MFYIPRQSSNSAPCKWLSLRVMTSEVTHLFLVIPDVHPETCQPQHPTQYTEASSRLPPTQTLRL